MRLLLVKAAGLCCLVTAVWTAAAETLNTPDQEPAYFYIAEGEDKCFTANAPEGMPLSVSYNNRDNQGISCSLFYRDPRNRVVFSRQVGHAAPKGKITYLTKMAGDFKVCISCPTSQWFATSKIKWSLSIELGDSDNTNADIAKKGHIDDLEENLNQVLRRLDIHSAENSHQRIQEESFFGASESISFRFVVFAIVKITILLLCTTISVYHLTRFFQTQKLI